MKRRFLFVSLGVCGIALLVSCSSTKTAAQPPAAPAPPPAVSAAAPPAPPPPPAVAPPAAPAPPSEVAAPAPAATAASGTEQAVAYFYRKKRFVGGALNTSVHVDKVEIADLDPGTYVKVPLSPGQHSFYSDEDDETLNLEVEPGKEYYFRIELRAGMWKGHGVLKLLDPREGAPEFEKWELKQAKDIRKPELVIKDPRKP